MKNIPRVIRNSLKPSYEEKLKNRETEAVIPELYSEKQDSVKTRKGKWEVFTRKSSPVSWFIQGEAGGSGEGFCAVYHRDGAPCSFVKGGSADRMVITGTLDVLTKKMIEQLPLFSRPAKGLTFENGIRYGMRLGLTIMIFVAAFVVFDLFLIPNNPEAISRGLAISFGGGDSAGLDLTGYESLTLKLVLALFGEEYLHLAYSFYTLVAFFVLPVIIIAVWCDIAGRRSDRLRMKKLPPEAENFLYGIEARDALDEELALKRNEEKKTRLFQQLSGLGMNTERETFQAIFDDMTGD